MLNKSSNFTLKVNSTNFTVLNGGILSANLYKISNNITAFQNNNLSNSTNATA
jgi:hypothetical protein